MASSSFAAPTLPDGLLLWLDASARDSVHLSDNFVEQWDNLAPGFSNSVTSVGDKRPVYIKRDPQVTRSSIRFDGVDDVLLDSGFKQEAKEWTLFIVAAPYGPAGGGAFVSATPKDGNDFDPGFTVDLYQSGASFDCVSIEGAGRIDGQLDQMTRAYPYASLQLLTVERDTREVRLYVNGMLEGTRPAMPAMTIMDAVRVGARFYDGTERAWFLGEISQVLLFNRRLRPQEKSAVERMLFVTSSERDGPRIEKERLEEERRKNRMVAPVLTRAWPDIQAFLSGQPDGKIGALHRDLAELPVRTDIKKAISLSMTHLVSLFDADKDNEPYFYSNCRPDGTGEMHHSLEIGIPHVTGRCLLGGIAAERATGMKFSEAGVSILERYVHLSVENPYKLNAYLDPKIDHEAVVELHSMREGLYGFWALIEARNSASAKKAAAEMVDALYRITDENGVWTRESVEQLIPAGRYGGRSIPNATRMVEALLAYHRVSENPKALKLAGLYARVGLDSMYEDDGRFGAQDRSSGHVHSITSALSGITEYALLKNDEAMLQKCIRIMERGVPEYHSSWGWGDEVFPDHPANVVGRGEINQTGDVVRTALFLGASGRPEYYEMAERWLRGMLLPTQYHEDDLRAFMHENANSQRDAERNIIKRTVGGYAMQFPNARKRKGDWPLSTLDITSGAVHAMSECYRRRVTQEGDVSRLNLLFDYEGPDVTIDSAMPLEGRIAFGFGTAKTLLIRVPVWVDAKTLRLTVDEKEESVILENGYLKIDAAAGRSGVLEFAVPCKVEKETVDGTEYTTTWIGNQIVDIQPRGTVSPLPF